MHDSGPHTEIPIGSERSFAFVFTGVFALIGVFPALSGSPIRLWAVLVAVAMSAVGFVFPRVLSVPNRLWFHLGLALGAVTSQVVMFVLFFGVMTPTGLVMRMFRRRLAKNADDRFPDPEIATYWVPRGLGENPMGSMRNQY